MMMGPGRQPGSVAMTVDPNPGEDSQVCEHIPKDTLGNMAASEQITPVVVSMINTTP